MVIGASVVYLIDYIFHLLIFEIVYTHNTVMQNNKKEEIKFIAE